MPQTFYAEGRSVFCQPEKTEKGHKLGFLVCECSEFVEGAAEEIAKALNLKSKLEERLKALRITCPEATVEDRVYEAAPEVMEEIADIIGYAKRED